MDVGLRLAVGGRKNDGEIAHRAMSARRSLGAAGRRSRMRRKQAIARAALRIDAASIYDLRPAARGPRPGSSARSAALRANLMGAPSIDVLSPQLINVGGRIFRYFGPQGGPGALHPVRQCLRIQRPAASRHQPSQQLMGTSSVAGIGAASAANHQPGGQHARARASRHHQGQSPFKLAGLER